MNKKIILLTLALVGFSTYSAIVVYQFGYIGVWKAGFTNLATMQILIDLFIGCFIICSWMIGDARARGKTIWPWLVGTLLLGTIAPLLYLWLREKEKMKEKKGNLESLSESAETNGE